MADTFPTELTHQHLIVKPNNTRTLLPHTKKKTNKIINIFFILISHVVTIFPTGMSATYGLNLFRCEVLFCISGDAIKS
jgi:hypothetical protein